MQKLQYSLAFAKSRQKFTIIMHSNLKLGCYSDITWNIKAIHLNCTIATAIRKHSSIIYLGKTKEISNWPYWCVSRITAKEATNLHTKHADRMILPSGSHKHSQTYLTVCGSRYLPTYSEDAVRFWANICSMFYFSTCVHRQCTCWFASDLPMSSHEVLSFIHLYCHW